VVCNYANWLIVGVLNEVLFYVINVAQKSIMDKNLQNFGNVRKKKNNTI
jgi:hypothetical protein